MLIKLEINIDSYLSGKRTWKKKKFLIEKPII